MNTTSGIFSLLWLAAWCAKPSQALPPTPQIFSGTIYHESPKVIFSAKMGFRASPYLGKEPIYRREGE